MKILSGFENNEIVKGYSSNLSFMTNAVSYDENNAEQKKLLEEHNVLMNAGLEAGKTYQIVGSDVQIGDVKRRDGSIAKSASIIFLCGELDASGNVIDLAIAGRNSLTSHRPSAIKAGFAGKTDADLINMMFGKKIRVTAVNVKKDSTGTPVLNSFGQQTKIREWEIVG